MKYPRILSLFLFCLPLLSSAQVGIGTASPDASAMIDVTSTNSGMLVPRMTQLQRLAIPSPSPGLLLYQTDNTPGFYYYSASAWVYLPGSNQGGWELGGNSGTDPSSNYIGTADDSTLMLQVNGLSSGKIASVNPVTAFGYRSLSSFTPKSPPAGYNPRDVNHNTAFGNMAMKLLNVGDHNAALGDESLESMEADDNVAAGTFALRLTMDGGDNTALGPHAMEFNEDGYDNTAAGWHGLEFTNGDENTALGVMTMDAGSTGDGNTIAGGYSLYWNPSGSQNSALGDASGYTNAGSSNVFLGYQAGLDESDDNKLYISNSATFNPLIYGDFLSGKVTIHMILKLAPLPTPPGSPVEGEIYINAVDHHIYCFLNGSWAPLD